MLKILLDFKGSLYHPVTEHRWFYRVPLNYGMEYGLKSGMEWWNEMMLPYINV